jgi:adenosylcobinamide kinase / adenosylcobinamide-phosphate guanylyltransferase
LLIKNWTIMAKLTFLIGGARSGKSTYAEILAKQHPGKVLYIATAQALDPEMAERIEKHKEQRPGEWQTLEIPHQVGARIKEPLQGADLVLLDCLTMLVSNIVLEAGGNLDQPDEAGATQAVDNEIEALIKAIQNSLADWIIVSNEVGMGLVPPYPIGRIYRDLLGWANRKMADLSDEILLLVAGRVIPLHELGESFTKD